MQDLRISLVQGATRWHDPAGNREYYGDLIKPCLLYTSSCV